MLKHLTLDPNLIRSECCQTIAAQAHKSPTVLVNGRSIHAEICGVIILNDQQAWEPVQLINHSSDPLFFEMGEDFELYRDRAIAIYHSHHGDEVSGELSDVDITNSIECNIPYLSYHADFDQWDYFDPNGLHPFPLEQNPVLSKFDPAYYAPWRFRYGRSDCWRVVRSWYAGVLSIEAGDHPRTALTPIHAQFSSDRAKAQGFDPHPKDVLIRDHDVLLMDMHQGRSNHVAVVIDAEANLILHTVGFDHYSKVENYDQSWRDRTRTIYRHREVPA
jgi:proteasome lid subunit RPN8/RPN11